MSIVLDTERRDTLEELFGVLETLHDQFEADHIPNEDAWANGYDTGRLSGIRVAMREIKCMIEDIGK